MNHRAGFALTASFLSLRHRANFSEFGEAEMLTKGRSIFCYFFPSVKNFQKNFAP